MKISTGTFGKARLLFEARQLVARYDAIHIESIVPVFYAGIAVVGAVEGFAAGLRGAVVV